jgi:hypothetical protein
VSSMSLESDLRHELAKMRRALMARIIECPWCHTRFLKVGKRKFCTPKCSEKMGWQRFAAKRPQRDYRAERAAAAAAWAGQRVGVGQDGIE